MGSRTMRVRRSGFSVAGIVPQWIGRAYWRLPASFALSVYKRLVEVIMSIGRPKKYVKDYKVVEEAKPNGKGVRRRAVYTGKYYRFDMTDEAYKGLKIIFSALSAAWLVAIIAGLFIEPSSFGGTGKSGQFYVLIPYVSQLVPSFMAASKVVMLLLAERDMQRFQYEDYVVKLRIWPVVGIVMAGIVFVGQLAAIISGVEAGTEIRAAALMILEALLAFGCWFFIRVFDRYKCIQTDASTVE